jgi:hypothetical protein
MLCAKQICDTQLIELEHTKAERVIPLRAARVRKLQFHAVRLRIFV